MLGGLTALRSKYDPVLELDAIAKALEHGNVGTDEERIFDTIIDMSPEDRTWTYAVLKRVDETSGPSSPSSLRTSARSSSTTTFTGSPAGGRTKNRDQVTVVDRMLSMGLRQVELAGAGSRTVLSPGPELDIEIPEWPGVPQR